MRRSQRKPPPEISGLGLRWLSYKERHRRQNEAITDALLTAEASQSDPGLREIYASLPRLPIRLIACPLGKSVNQGGLLRLGDAFRLDEVSFSLEHDLAYDGAAHRGTIARQPHVWERAPAAIRRAMQDGYTPVALTLSDSAVSITDFDWPCPVALVVGSEADGIDPESLSMCPYHVAIPLYGLVTSLNVATAAAIALHDAVSTLRLREGWEPVRNSSRRLLGYPPVDYRADSELLVDHAPQPTRAESRTPRGE
jgi:tRNA G18 (ribose-2'-O)-methylase SpoU